MPNAPIIIPLIVAGVLFGSSLKQHGKLTSKKSLAIATIASGLLNGAHAYLLDLMTPQPTTTFARASFTFRPTSTISFVISSIVIGMLIVLFVVVVAAVYSRSARKTEAIGLEEKSADETLA